jgi:CHAT domain-containing protein
VAALFEERQGQGREAGPTARVLTGLQATEEAFKALAPEYEYLHLATHAFLLNDSCASPEGVAIDLPLQLSGLALAGANRRRAVRAGGEDGILTAEEVAGLDLSRVRWATLSACDTGVGTVEAGEGVLGLRRAFALAGARTLLLTLWAVDDRGARRWMRAAYAARARNLGAAAAVRQASLEVLKERRDRGLDTSPLHWGGFSAAGDWR